MKNKAGMAAILKSRFPSHVSFRSIEGGLAGQCCKVRWGEGSRHSNTATDIGRCRALEKLSAVFQERGNVDHESDAFRRGVLYMYLPLRASGNKIHLMVANDTLLTRPVQTLDQANCEAN